MDENINESKSLWNKTSAELTVGDIMKVNVAYPLIAVGGIVAAVVAVGQISKVGDKLRSVRAARKIKELTEAIENV